MTSENIRQRPQGGTGRQPRRTPAAAKTPAADGQRTGLTPRVNEAGAPSAPGPDAHPAEPVAPRLDEAAAPSGPGPDAHPATPVPPRVDEAAAPSGPDPYARLTAPAAPSRPDPYARLTAPVAPRVDEAAAPSGPGPDARPAAPVARRARGRTASVAIVTLLALVGAALMAGVALAYINLTPKTYSAEALVIILSQSGSNDVNPITAAWVDIATAPTVLAGAADSLGVPVGELQKALTVSQPSSTPLVSIKMVTTDAQRSASWANAVADQLLLQADRRPIAGFAMSQLTRAVPAREADPDQNTLLLVGATAVGALLGGMAGTSLAGRRRS